MNINAAYFVNALLLQVLGKTEECLEVMEKVEPMQEADACEALDCLLKFSPDVARKLIDALVNNAIVGMTDNRTEKPLTFEDKLISFLSSMDKQQTNPN